MSLTLNATPEKIIDGIESNAAASRSQLPYLFQRKDNILESLLDDGTGKCRIYFPTSEGTPLNYSAGDAVFIYFKPTSVYKTGIYNVLSSGGAPNFQIVINEPYIVTEDLQNTAYINNLTARPLYRAQVAFFDKSGTKLINLEPKFAPQQNGELFIDVKNYINAVQELELAPSLEYVLGYRETWLGGEIGELNRGFTFTVIGEQTATDFRPTLAPAVSAGEFIIGRRYLITFTDQTIYKNGFYECSNNVGNPRFLKPFTATGSTAGAIPQSQYFEAPEVQAIYAKKQVGKLGGSNLWDYLLRAADSTKTNGFKFPADQLTPIVVNATFTPWIERSKDNLVITIPNDGTATGSSNWLGFYEPINSIITQGSKYLISYKIALAIEDFVSIGEVRLDIGLVADNGAQTYIFIKTLENVTGNHGYTEISFSSTANVTLNAKQLYFRVLTLGGANFTAKIDIKKDFGRFLNCYTVPPAKLLTKFKEPLAWRGWPRSVSLLIDKNYTSRGLTLNPRKQFQAFDINKGFISTIDTGTFDTQSGTPQTIALKIPETEGFFTSASVLDNSYNVIAERLFYKWLEPCRNPVMIRWLNSLGAFDEHLFSIGQEYNIKASGGLTYNRALVSDQEFSIGQKRRLYSEPTSSILLTAENLTQNQALALAEIKTSPIVYAFTQPDESDLVRVITRESLDTGFDTRNNNAVEFRVLIELPENYSLYDRD